MHNKEKEAIMRIDVKFEKDTASKRDIVIQIQQHTVGSITEPIQVELEQGQPLKIRVMERPAPKITLLRGILWLLTFPLRLLFMIIMSYGGVEPWDRHINPYLMDAELLVRPDQNSEVHVKICEATEGRWTKTVVECPMAETVEIRHALYSEGILESYFEYADSALCGALAVSSLSILCFCTSENTAYPEGVRIVGIALAVIVLIVIGVAVAQYGKVRKLRKSLLDEIKN